MEKKSNCGKQGLPWGDADFSVTGSFRNGGWWGLEKTERRGAVEAQEREVGPGSSVTKDPAGPGRPTAVRLSQGRELEAEAHSLRPSSLL